MLHWHAQPIVLALRGFPSVAGFPGIACFAAGADYTVNATVQLLGHGKANIQSHLAKDGRPITRRDYQALLDLLREKYGVDKVLAVRGGEDTEYDTAPAPLT